MARLTAGQFRRKFRRLEEKFPDLVETGLTRGAVLTVGHIQKKYLSGPRSKSRLGARSGTLRRRIHYKIKRTPRITAAVGVKLVYARIHEKGGVIKAKNSPYLHFKIGDQWVMVKRVKMPARPYLEPGVKDMRGRVMSEISEAVLNGYG